MFHFKSIAFAACLVMAASGQSAASSYDDCRNGNGFLDPEKQFAHCDEALKAALDTKPRAFLQFKRGEALYWMDNFGPALADVDLAIQGDPQLVPAYIRRTWIYLTLGQWQKASRDIEEILAQEPGNAEGLFALSYLYTSTEPNSARALEALRQSLEINPDFHLARLNLAYRNYYLGDLEGMVGVAEPEHRLPRGHDLRDLGSASRHEEGRDTDALILEELLLPRHEVLAVDKRGDTVGECDGASSLRAQHARPACREDRHPGRTRAEESAAPA